MTNAANISRFFCTIALACLISGCGGGGSNGSTQPPPPGTGGSSEPPPPPPDPVEISYSEAFRFLQQSTFGPTPTDIESLQSIGYEAWIDEQQLLPVSTQLSYWRSLPVPVDLEEGHSNRMDAWFQNTLRGQDQLRQRVTFALSQIMVVSDQSELKHTPEGLANYYDLLSQHAFGNFRELMQAVTLSPIMGIYLSMLGNEKPDSGKNIRPDENFARELMQLFTIGLVKLNLDGSVIMDNTGQPTPSYNQQTVEGFAHVYTGWTFAGSSTFHAPSFDYINPMQSYSEFHDTGEKQLLNGALLPAGQSADQDLEQALDNIYQHPNVAPFISHRLIQRLITANPSPEYIARVANTFNDDGSGARGNLFAVVKSILLDKEARSATTSDTSGKLVEPLLRLTALWRAYDAKATNGRYLFANPESKFGQAPMRASTVFNFFTPHYAPAGEINNLSLVSPEMQIINERSSALTTTYLAFAILLQHSQVPELQEETIFINIETELPFANQPEVLIARTVDRLLGGTISDSLMESVTTMVNLIPEEEPASRVVEAIHTIVTSPEFALLR